MVFTELQNKLKKFFIEEPATSILFLYSFIIFFVGLGDALISYALPIFLENNLKNSVLMGALLATSSFSSIMFDLIFSKRFNHKPYAYFLTWTFFTALFLAVLLLSAPPITPFFILGMIVWGVRYELLQFANYRFIHAFRKKDQHAHSWGVISTFKCTAYVVGPLLGSILISYYIRLPFVFSIFFLVAGFVTLYLFRLLYEKKSAVHDESIIRKTILQEIKILHVLFEKVWPLWLFSFALLLIDAAFWSIGILISEEIGMGGPLSGTLIVMYMLPSVFVGYFAGKAGKPLGKKRAAFVSGILNGLFLIIAGFTKNPTIFILLVFLSSLFGTVAIPEILAVFEDYVSRLDKFANEVISLERTSENAAYIIGPILAGFLSSIFGFYKTFSILGGFLFIISVLCIFVVPRKIHMPQKELTETV